MVNSDAAFAVQQLIARFANSFDRKDWDALRACLAASLHTDYSDLRGTPPETITAERFVELRRAALHELRTHHLAANLELELGDGRGDARVSMVIYRRNGAGAILNTHCVYTFGVERTDGRWVISSIVQKVLWSDGDPAIHAGIAKT